MNMRPHGLSLAGGSLRRAGIALTTAGVVSLGGVLALPTASHGQSRRSAAAGIAQLKARAAGAAATTPVTDPMPASCTVAGAPKPGTLPSGLYASLGLSFPAKYTSDRNAANRRAARLDAQHLMALLPVPSGATVVDSEPSGDHGYLTSADELFPWSSAVVDDSWWISSVAPATLIGDFVFDLPAGSIFTGTTGAYSGTGTPPDLNVTSCSVGATFAWQPVLNKLGSRTVTIIATTLTDGQTGVHVWTQSQWVQLRPTSERIPAGVSSIRVHSSLSSLSISKRFGSKWSITDSVTRTFTTLGRIRSVVGLIDAMPIVQETGPGEGGEGHRQYRTITVGFYGASGRRLGLMIYSIPHGRGVVSDEGTTELQIGKLWRPSLIGGDFIYKLERLVGMKLL